MFQMRRRSNEVSLWLHTIRVTNYEYSLRRGKQGGVLLRGSGARRRKMSEIGYELWEREERDIHVQVHCKRSRFGDRIRDGRERKGSEDSKHQ